MKDAIDALENQQVDIFIIYDEKTPNEYLGVLTTSDFAEFM